MPHLDIDIGTLYYRPVEAGLTPVCLRFSHPPETRIPCGQDQLTEVGHSVDGSVFQALHRFVLSMCYSIDTTREHAYDRWRILKLFCGSWFHSCVATPPRRPCSVGVEF